jgi:hypothetical protein
MNHHFCIIVIGFLLIGCNNSSSENTTEETEKVVPLADTTPVYKDPIFEMHQDFDTLVFDDVNNDKSQDTVIIVSPIFGYDYGGCEDDSCLTQVFFSFTKFKLNHPDALGFLTFFPTGDLNSDGISEFAFIPKWFQSCWQGLYVYSLTKNGWKKIGKGTVFACQEEDWSRRITKINNHSFTMISTELFSEEVGMAVDTAIVINW